MNFTLDQIEGKIALCESELSKPDLQPEDRRIFADALQRALAIKQEILAKSGPSINPPHKQAGERPRYTRQAIRQPPIATQQEATPEQLEAYLAGRDKAAQVAAEPGAEQGSGKTTVPAAADQKKTPVVAAGTATSAPESGKFFRVDKSNQERVVVFEVTVPDQFVPSYRFVIRGKETILKPGEIRQLFRSRMNALEQVKKPLTHSVMLPQMVAWYEALAMYENRELSLADFNFSSARKQQIFKIIQEQAGTIVQNGRVDPALHYSRKPRYSQRAAAKKTFLSQIREKARAAVK